MQAATLVRAVLVTLIALALTACHDLPPESARAATAHVRPATPAEQKTCAEQAKRRFYASDASDPAEGHTGQYSSSYDADENVCYVLIHETGTTGNVPYRWYQIADAFSGDVYGCYIWQNPDRRSPVVPPIECTIKPHGQPDVTCNSGEEFERLARQYFGIAR